MKKTASLILVLSVFTLSSFAQKKQKFVLTVEQGINLPVGQFSENQNLFQLGGNETKINGGAKPGYLANVSGAYYFRSKLAVVVNAGLSINKQSKEGLEEAYGGASSGYTFSTKVKSWKAWRFLGGLSYDIQFAETSPFFLQTKLLAGFAITKLPEYEITGVSNSGGGGGQPSAFQVKTSGFKFDPAFAWQANAGVGYWFRKNVFAMLGLGYFDAQPEYNYTITMIGNPNNGEEASIKARLSALALTANIGFRF